MRFTVPPFFGKYYAIHVLRPQNTESGKPEINKIGDKLQYINELIIHNDIRNARGNQITDIIQEPHPLLWDD